MLAAAGYADERSVCLKPYLVHSAPTRIDEALVRAPDADEVRRFAERIVDRKLQGETEQRAQDDRATENGAAAGVDETDDTDAASVAPADGETDAAIVAPVDGETEREEEVDTDPEETAEEANEPVVDVGAEENNEADGTNAIAQEESAPLAVDERVTSIAQYIEKWDAVTGIEARTVAAAVDAYLRDALSTRYRNYEALRGTDEPAQDAQNDEINALPIEGSTQPAPNDEENAPPAPNDEDNAPPAPNDEDNAPLAPNDEDNAPPAPNDEDNAPPAPNGAVNGSSAMNEHTRIEVSVESIDIKAVNALTEEYFTIVLRLAMVVRNVREDRVWRFYHRESMRINIESEGVTVRATVREIVHRSVDALLTMATGEALRSEIVVYFQDYDLFFISGGKREGLTIGTRVRPVAPANGDSCCAELCSPQGFPPILRVIETYDLFAVAHNVGGHDVSVGATWLTEHAPWTIEPYLHIVIPDMPPPIAGVAPSVVLSSGVRILPEDGFLRFQPFFGAQIDMLFEPTVGLFPAYLFGGFAMNWRIGRLSIAPRVIAGAGIGPIVRSSGIGYALYVGGSGMVNAQFALTDTLSIAVDAGYAQWIPLIADDPIGNVQAYTPLSTGYGGIVVGAAINIYL